MTEVGREGLAEGIPLLFAIHDPAQAHVVIARNDKQAIARHTGRFAELVEIISRAAESTLDRKCIGNCPVDDVARHGDEIDLSLLLGEIGAQRAPDSLLRLHVAGEVEIREVGDDRFTLLALPHIVIPPQGHGEPLFSVRSDRPRGIPTSPLVAAFRAHSFDNARHKSSWWRVKAKARESAGR